MTRRENPYKEGSACWFAYETGYCDAIEDANRLLEGNTYGNDHTEERTAGMPEHHEE